jgi:hypothetical protein
MNKRKIIILAALIALAATAVCTALETNIKTIATQTFEVDLGPEFAIDQDLMLPASNGLILENLTLFNKKHPLKQKADIMLFMFYEKEALGFDPSLVALLFDSIGTSSFISNGWSEIGNWTTTSKRGNDVSIHSLSRDGQNMNFAFWQMNDGIYAYMNSVLDNNTTERIVNTANIK